MVALPLTFVPQLAQPASNIATLTPPLRPEIQDPVHKDQAHQVKKSA
jgi:hypothetical protein